MNPFLKTYDTDQADHELIKSALEGNRTAIDRLLKKHQPFIYNIAWKMVRMPQDAEDLTQEALLKITLNLSKFQFKSNFRTWAYRIVVNHFLNSTKKPSEKSISGFDYMVEGLEATPDVELTELEIKEQEHLIREMNLMCMSGMLLCLNREQRMIYIIGEMFGADHNVGSEIMNMSKDNFRAKLSKARKDLYNFMNNQCGLVNKDNPCRCYKKVTAAVNGGFIDAKNLLFNHKDYSTFKREIQKDADYMLEFADKNYIALYDGMSYRQGFDKKTFIKDILDNMKVKKAMNLN